VPGATITVTDANEGFRFTTKTEQDGYYVLRNLASGTHALEGGFTGMRAYKRSNVVLTLGHNAQANITFELAGMQQMVEVSASAAASPASS
jgi:hypothetical protein